MFKSQLTKRLIHLLLTSVVEETVWCGQLYLQNGNEDVPTVNVIPVGLTFNATN